MYNIFIGHLDFVKCLMAVVFILYLFVWVRKCVCVCAKQLADPISHSHFHGKWNESNENVLRLSCKTVLMTGFSSFNKANTHIVSPLLCFTLHKTNFMISLNGERLLLLVSWLINIFFSPKIHYLMRQNSMRCCYTTMKRKHTKTMRQKRKWKFRRFWLCCDFVV